MATQKEMCTVRVYVENNNDDDEDNRNHNTGNATITKEDIVDWLSLLDKLEEVKLQYDASVQQMCYLVCFAHATAAQQAVQYLSGAKLKNYKIIITSTVYKRQDVPNNEEEERNEQIKTGNVKRKNEIEASNKSKDEWQVETLPFNHLIPLDIRMDTALAEYLPEICKGDDNKTNKSMDNIAFTGAPELYNVLCTLQEQMHNSLMELETLRNSVYHLNDIHVPATDINNHNSDSNKGNLHDANNTSSISNNTHEVQNKTEDANVESSKTTSLITFGNTKGIGFTAHPPVKVIGFLTRCFGVVSRCTSVLLSTSNNEYLLRIAFMMNEDAHDFALFLSTLRHTNNNNKKRNANFVNRFLQDDEMYDKMCELFRNSAWQELPSDAWNWNAIRSFQLPNNTNNVSSNSNAVANTTINNPAHQMIASLLSTEVEN